MRPIPAVTAASPMTERTAWRALADEAGAPYRQAGRFAWHFARGKLRFDPVFAHVMRSGLVRAGDRVLDIGCGQGLLASLVDAANRQPSNDGWPSTWRATPIGAHVTGIDIAPREIARARTALDTRATFHCDDMRVARLPTSDVVVLLDALHYISHAEQDALLARVRDALAPGGRLAMRVGDGAAHRRGGFARTVDHVVAFVRQGHVVPQSTRTADAWIDALVALGLEVDALPMGQGTPFANVWLVGSTPAEAANAALASRLAPSTSLTAP